MNSLSPRATYLFKKYYNKTASSEEINELYDLLKNTSDDDLLLLMREEWENFQSEQPLFDDVKSYSILNNILPDQDNAEVEEVESSFRRLKFYSRMKVAAAIVMALSFGAYFLTRPVTLEETQFVTEPLFKDVPPGGNKAVLTLTSGKSIVLDSLKNGLILKTGSFEINKVEDGQLVYSTINKTPIGHYSADLNMISTPVGGEYRVVLPDGSKVWLNSASSIKFPAVFKGNYREIELKGEAYFEIAKNVLMPFRVKSNQAVVEVLGTHFNVRAYGDEKAMKTTLVEGSVKIRSQNASSLLKPGEQAVLEGDQLTLLKDVDVEAQIAWKNGLFQFKDAGLAEVMKQAALWYDLDVSYEGNIPVRYFTGKISRKVNASEFLNMLRYTGVEFRAQGRNITVKK